MRKKKLKTANFSTSATYGVTSSVRRRFFGAVSPFELSQASRTSQWTVREVIPVSEVTVTSGQMNNTDLQNLINNLVSGGRLNIPAGTFFGIGNLVFASKPIQIVGAIDANGKPATKINGSEIVSGFSLVSGKYRASVNAVLSPLPETGATGVIGFYPDSQKQVWLDDRPLNIKSSLGASTGQYDFYYDGTYIYLNQDPTGKVVRWSRYTQFIAPTLENGNNATYATDFVTIKNLELTQYAGNCYGAVIGRRYHHKTTGFPMMYHHYENIRIHNCRGAAINTHLRSIVKNCISENNGYGAIDPHLTDVAWGNIASDQNTKQIYTKIIGCKNSRNNWAGYDGAVSNKITRTWYVDWIENEFSYNGRCESAGVDVPAHGFWADFCNRNRLFKNKSFENNTTGFFIEICFNFTLEDNEAWNNNNNIYDYFNNQQFSSPFPAEIFNSTSKDSIYRRNKIRGNPAKTSHAFILLDIDRGAGDQEFDNITRVSDNFLCENNDIKPGLNSQTFNIQFRRSGYPSPDAWKGFTGKNIRIRNNTHVGTPVYRLLENDSTYTYDTFTGLAAIQGITDSNSASFNWEQGSTNL